MDWSCYAHCHLHDCRRRLCFSRTLGGRGKRGALIAEIIRSRGAGFASIERQRGPVIVVTRDELHRSLRLFWPTDALVVTMFPLGIDVWFRVPLSRGRW